MYMEATSLVCKFPLLYRQSNQSSSQETKWSEREVNFSWITAFYNNVCDWDWKKIPLLRIIICYKVFSFILLQKNLRNYVDLIMFCFLNWKHCSELEKEVQSGRTGDNPLYKESLACSHQQPAHVTEMMSKAGPIRTNSCIKTYP